MAAPAVGMIAKMLLAQMAGKAAQGALTTAGNLGASPFMSQEQRRANIPNIESAVSGSLGGMNDALNPEEMQILQDLNLGELGGGSSLAGQVGTKSPMSMLQGIIKSDEDLKKIGACPKEYIGALIKSKVRLQPKDVKILLKAFPHFGKEGEEKYSRHVCSWNDATLNGYAEHIKNYPYKYKEEAKKLDPSIDCDQDHIGPMAQDIEKVVPAAVVTDKKTGYKAVDTGRLALATAGVVAELARELAAMRGKE
jgi:hypothetical protein